MKKINNHQLKNLPVIFGAKVGNEYLEVRGSSPLSSKFEDESCSLCPL